MVNEKRLLQVANSVFSERSTAMLNLKLDKIEAGAPRDGVEAIKYSVTSLLLDQISLCCCLILEEMEAPE